MEIMKLIRQNVSVGNEIELLSTEPLLHFNVVVAETVLASDFMTLRKVVNALEAVQSLVDIALA